MAKSFSSKHDQSKGETDGQRAVRLLRSLETASGEKARSIQISQECPPMTSWKLLAWVIVAMPSILVDSNVLIDLMSRVDPVWYSNGLQRRSFKRFQGR